MQDLEVKRFADELFSALTMKVPGSETPSGTYLTQALMSQEMCEKTVRVIERIVRAVL